MNKITVEDLNTEGFDTVRDAEIQLNDIQKKYNIMSKNIAYTIGKNLTLFICMMVPALLIGFIWTDLGAILIGPKLVSDGVITVALFVVGEIMMTKLGGEGGKIDSEFIKTKTEFEEILNKVNEIGTLFMGRFCEWQIDLELEQAVNHRLRKIRMSKAEWEEVKILSEKELKEKYGEAKAINIMKIYNLKPIELSEDILLFDGENVDRGGIPISGDSYIRNKWHYIEIAIACLFTGLLTVSVVVTLTNDISVARVVYTIFKLVMLLFRMARGYDRGARAFNTIEVRRLKAKSNYLRQYIKFMEDKVYLEIEEKYGDLYKTS